MAYSALIQGHIQQTAAMVGRFKVFHGESFQRFPNYHYINAPIKPEVVEKIKLAIGILTPQDGESVLIQIWGATKTNNKSEIHLLTTTGQPYALYGKNKELKEYRRGCLHHKLYVYEDSKGEKGAAFGLPGLVFLNRTHEQTQNMHKFFVKGNGTDLSSMTPQDMLNYLKDRRPPCEDSIFERVWGSYAVPVFDAGQCVCVLEFVTDTPKNSYNDDILAISSALQHAGLQFSIQIDRPRELKMISGHKRDRTTKTSDVTKYCCLVPYMGLTKEVAAEKLSRDSATKKLEEATALEKLGQTTAAKKLRDASAKQKTIKESTFRNIRENAGLPEWPYKRVPTARATSVYEETSPYVTPTADLASIPDEGIPIITGHIEASDACPNDGVKYQGNDAPIQGMDIDHQNAADMDFANNTIWDNEFLEQPWGHLYIAIPSGQETRPSQIAFETSGARTESATVNEDYDPLDFIDLDKIEELFSV